MAGYGSFEAGGLPAAVHANSGNNQLGHRPLGPGAERQGTGRPGTERNHPNIASNASMFIGSHHSDDPDARLSGGMSNQFAAGFAPFDAHSGQPGVLSAGALSPL